MCAVSSLECKVIFSFIAYDTLCPYERQGKQTKNKQKSVANRAREAREESKRNAFSIVAFCLFYIFCFLFHRTLSFVSFRFCFDESVFASCGVNETLLIIMQYFTYYYSEASNRENDDIPVTVCTTISLKR